MDGHPRLVLQHIPLRARYPCKTSSQLIGSWPGTMSEVRGINRTLQQPSFSMAASSPPRPHRHALDQTTQFGIVHRQTAYLHARQHTAAYEITRTTGSIITGSDEGSSQGKEVHSNNAYRTIESLLFYILQICIIKTAFAVAICIKQMQRLLDDDAGSAASPAKLAVQCPAADTCGSHSPK